jgi:uncharacterized protein YcfJ
MKITQMANRFLVACILTALIVTAGNAQTAPPSGQKTLASTIDVYVFPTEGQTPETQSNDEAACYQWAVQNTGTDPFELSKQSQQQAQQTQQAQRHAQQVGTGAGVAGAARGAAVGALVGEIASDDWGKGAAWGAAAGAVAGRRRARMARGYAQTQVASQGQQAQQATSTQLTNFKKAFSVCLEAKKYIVKY